MDGMIFYWVFWGVWILATFIMRKRGLRLWMAAGCLIVIIASGITLHINSYDVNAAFILMFLIGICINIGSPLIKLFYHTVVNYILMMLYFLYHCYQMYDPAIRLIVPQWLFLMVIFGTIQMLIKPFRFRLSILLSGTCMGEGLKTVIIQPKNDTIGNYNALDTLAFFILLAVGWHVLNWSLNFLQQVINKSQVPKTKVGRPVERD
ncbi:hypothetical protein EV207_102149 [Scopulibacillus darangshiensis]|uniref:Uncharacterized protein n=1 Tax=Scopulibacillus darangshiensis TaxID=442528 RepID=A0A4R2P9F4_9BACL|nr:hypothetical protein [Scopulibacillus darangshiensis]TCP31659.1 hypothetical protein EV207_102149 [Scopulibacillus darangshiensis]